MRIRFSSQTKRQGRRLFKRLVRTFFPDPVYVAKSGLARGFKLTGDLGYLGKLSTRRNRFLLSLNLAQQTVYDIGSYIGVTTLFFSKAVGPTGQVVAFEPNPETFPLLCKNVEMNGLKNAKLCNVRLDRKREKVAVAFCDRDDVWGTVVGPAGAGTFPSDALKTEAIPMEVYPLDEYVDAASLPPPDFIKMDAEGYEFDVLLGMQNILRQHSPGLLVEIHGETEMRLPNLRKIVEFLLTLNYDIREMHSRRRIADGSQIRRARHVFCRPEGQIVHASILVAPPPELSPHGILDRGDQVAQELKRIPQ